MFDVFAKVLRPSHVAETTRSRVTHNGYWVCFQNLDGIQDHCKALLNVENGSFRVANNNGPTGKLFAYYYTGIIVEGVAIWNAAEE